MPRTPPALIVSVDTEEEFDWNATGTPQAWTITHAGAFPRFQEVCQEFGVRPTYLIDHPIAMDEQAVEILGKYHKAGECEIGTHIHPWVNPPIREELCPRNTFLSNLPLSLQEDKLSVLTDVIRQAFGGGPTSFKAGRYGIDFSLVRRLRELGYTVDTSVIAYTSFASESGPCFSEMGPEPFWILEDGPTLGAHEMNMTGQEPLLEVPCSVGFNRRPFLKWAAIHRRLAGGAFQRLRAIGILNRLGILRKIVLSPEIDDTPDLVTLMSVMAEGPESVLNVTLHSPSLQAGHTPFVRTAEDLERFYRKLRAILEWAVHRIGAAPMTLRQFQEHYRQTTLGNAGR